MGYTPNKLYTLDLHGYTVEQARSRLLEVIDMCFCNGYTVLRIIHGYGTGKVKAVVYDEASNNELVKSIGGNVVDKGYLDLILEDRE